MRHSGIQTIRVVVLSIVAFIVAASVSGCMLGMGSHRMGMSDMGCGMGMHDMNHSMDSGGHHTMAMDTTGRGTGIVKGIDPAEKTLTIKHGNIPGIMAAMTMAYKVAETQMLQQVHVGDTVVFALTQRGGEYVITSLAKEATDAKR